MSETYPYGGAADGDEVGDIGDVAGACPPDEKWYRIYPEYDFDLIFDPPPTSVFF